MTKLDHAISQFGMDLALLGISQARALAEQIMPAVLDQTAIDLQAIERQRHGPCETCGQETDLSEGPECLECNGRV